MKCTIDKLPPSTILSRPISRLQQLVKKEQCTLRTKLESDQAKETRRSGEAALGLRSFGGNRAHRRYAADLYAVLKHDEAGDLAAGDADQRDAQALRQGGRRSYVQHPESEREMAGNTSEHRGQRKLKRRTHYLWATWLSPEVCNATNWGV